MYCTPTIHTHHECESHADATIAVRTNVRNRTLRSKRDMFSALLRSSLPRAAAVATAGAFFAGGVASCMRIEEEVKLDYKDVLLRPKRSTLRSRSEVSLDRTFHFRHSKRSWTGTPMIVANMDTVGTFTMATEMAKHHCIVAIHKHYTVDEWKQFAAEQPQAVPYVAVSAGTSANDMSKLYAAILI